MYPEGLDTNWDDPNKDSEHQKAKTTLLTWNTMFAAATNSSLWTLEHRKSYASELASLITTGSFADNSPLNDAVWIPRGFNLLLTGNNRDVGAPSLNPVQDSMSPLAINADFLTTLAHSVKLWEGMISNSLDKYGWRSCLHLNQSMTNLNTTITEGDLDPVTGILTAMGRQPKAALDFLASPDHATGGGTIDDSNWKWVLGRQKDYVALEGLTASLAGASNLRTSDTFTSRRAAWITEQGVIYLSGVKDSYFWNPTSKHNTAIMLANSVCDIWDIANDTKYEDCKPKPVFEQLLPKAWDGAHNNEVISLLQCILTDDTALRTLSNAAGNFTAHHLSTATLEVDRGTSTDAITDSTLLKKAYDQLLGNANMDAKLFGLIYGASAKGRNVETNEENELNQILVDTLFYSLAFAPTPGKPWIAAAASVAQDIAKGYAQDIVESAHKDAKTRNDSRELAGQRLNWSVLFAMSAAHMLPDNAYVGVSSEWAYKDEDGHWHINVEKASKDYVAFNNWVQHNTELLALMSSTGASINDAFANGFSKGSQ